MSLRDPRVLQIVFLGVLLAAGAFLRDFSIRHAWQGDPAACPSARDYFRDLNDRREHEAETLASLTGWDLDEIRGRIDFGPGDGPPPRARWWEKLWGRKG